ncbi:DUF6082 family protein [Mangrovihabitans endophyticus]|uniref:DUF6082 family protein n=1 Tax=Mangrovihabitans endophyticus TaxID=1751298 RepID=UPI0016636869|nr:DUF6082 family protein [Mangrovihabitans endophyticus]
MLTGTVVLIGIGLVSMLGQRGDSLPWAQWSDIGEAFGAVNAVASAFAVLALVITWALQARELRSQRTEIIALRTVVQRAEAALQRSADVDVRHLHVDLTRMAIENPDLAEVWPRHAEAAPAVRAQYLYANLLLQHAWLQHTTGLATREEMISNLRFLFASPTVRAFWRETANSRQSIYVNDSRELGLAATADQIWREYESVLACSRPADRSSTGREWAKQDVQDPTAAHSPSDPDLR